MAILFTVRIFTGNLLRGILLRNIILRIFVLMSDLGFEPWPALRPISQQAIY